MAALRLVVHAVFGLLFAWIVYRHLVVYLLRGRVIVATERVLSTLTFGLLWLTSFLFTLPVAITILVLGLAAAEVVARRDIWVVVGIPSSRVIERAQVVLRGMGFSGKETGELGLEEREGRIRIRIASSPTPLTHLLRVRTARGINKVALFRTNLRKFLVAIPRERR